MSTYAHLATAASTNLNTDLIRRNGLLWLEKQTYDLADAYKAARASGDAEAAAEIRARGLVMQARLKVAQQRERMGAE